MDFLIKAYWYQAEAAKLHIKVTDAQVQTAFTRPRSSSSRPPPQFQAFLSSDRPDARTTSVPLPDQPMFTKLLASTRRRSPPPRSRPTTKPRRQFGTPQTRNIRIVLAKTQAQADAAKAALKHGPELGRRWPRSTRPTPPPRTTGGLLNGVPRASRTGARHRRLLGPAQQAAGPGQGPVRLLRVEVTKITPATSRRSPRPPADQADADQPAADHRPDRGGQRAKKDWLSKTTCRRLYAMADCNGYKAPKTTSDATTRRYGATGRGTPRAPRVGSGSRQEAATAGRSRASTRSRAGCGGSAPGTASRMSGRSCRTRSRRPTSWPTPRTGATTPSSWDELGDVLFQVHFLALLLEERGAGGLAEVAEHCTEKLIRRHPHVFGEVQASDGAARSCATGTQIKQREEGPRAGGVRRGPREPALAAIRTQGPAPRSLDRV